MRVAVVTNAIEGQMIRLATSSDRVRDVKRNLNIDEMERQVLGISEAQFATISQSAKVRACIVLNRGLGNGPTTILTCRIMLARSRIDQVFSHTRDSDASTHFHGYQMSLISAHL